MRFSRLRDKLENFFGNLEQGRSIKPEKLGKLQQLLRDKISRYEAKLAASLDSGKQSKLETRLKVVRAQLEKSRNL